MNLGKKISNMGFKKTQFHKSEYDYNLKRRVMVPYVYEVNKHYDRKEKVWITTKKKVNHPKWSNFYVLKMNKELKVWMLTDKDIIVKVWVEYTKGVKEIYNTRTKSTYSINSKMDIIKLFPKEIQRDFILRDILG